MAERVSFRTPLGRVLGLGSARSGVHHWWIQRITSIAALPLSFFLIVFIMMSAGKPHAEIVALIHQPLVALGLILAIATLIRHMQLGMQVIIEDYVHNGTALLLSLLANNFVCIVMALIGIYAVLAIAFGA